MIQKIKHTLIRKLGGVTFGDHMTDLSRTAVSNYHHGYDVGQKFGYDKAKGRATGLVDGVWAKDDLGRPINLAKLLRERV